MLDEIVAVLRGYMADEERVRMCAREIYLALSRRALSAALDPKFEEQVSVAAETYRASFG